MEAVEALREIAFQLERAAEPTHRVRAFRRAAQVVSDLPAGELEQRFRDGTLEGVPGIGKVTAEVITQATAGQRPAYLARLVAEAPPPELRRAVTTAAAFAGSEREFFTRLELAGVLAVNRFSRQNPAQVTGYAVALPGDISRAGGPCGTAAGNSPRT